MTIVGRGYFQNEADNALAEFNDQYYLGRDYSAWEWDVEGTRSRLASLGENPSIESVIEVSPNSISSCDSCQKHKFSGVTVSQSDDYFGDFFYCLDCLKEAVSELEQAQTKKTPTN